MTTPPSAKAIPHPPGGPELTPRGQVVPVVETETAPRTAPPAIKTAGEEEEPASAQKTAPGSGRKVRSPAIEAPHPLRHRSPWPHTCPGPADCLTRHWQRKVLSDSKAAAPAKDLAPLGEFDSSSLSMGRIEEIAAALDRATEDGVEALRVVMPPERLIELIRACTRLVEREPTLIELQGLAGTTEVVVVGDTHGQYHDVRRLFQVAGPPSSDRIYVMNGDFVDRGSWGCEEMVLLMLLKCLWRGRFVLLRGNHETSFCSLMYGFQGELLAKYGRDAKAVFRAFKDLFKNLPLACLVSGSTLVLHGGLFRKPVPPPKVGVGAATDALPAALTPVSLHRRPLGARRRTDGCP